MRKPSRWSDRDRAYDQRLYYVEVDTQTVGGLGRGWGWSRMSIALPRNVASRRAVDLFLSYHKERGVRIVPEIEQ